MKISKDWLSDYIDLSDLSDEEFTEIVTTRVAEVDEVLKVGLPLQSAILAKIEEVNPLPEKNKLQHVRITTGANQSLEVVCAATNCRQGMYVAYVPPGGCIQGDAESGVLEVGERAFGDFISRGVLASERELGLSGDHAGLLEIDQALLDGASRKKDSLTTLDESLLGCALSELLGGTDTVLEIDNKSLTHRPDLWGHYGFVRELHAILNHPINENLDRFADVSEEGKELFAALATAESRWSVEIEPESECRRFAGIEISNIDNHRSPLWMRRRLFAVGAGVRNILVDLSNYVMHDVGQPNHTYDSTRASDYARAESASSTSKLALKIDRAKAGDTFTALDGSTFELSQEDTVVRGASAVLGLAGVMGGESTAITAQTDRIFLEAANWDPVRTRKTSVRHALRTDASNRFEKSLSTHLVAVGIQRFLELLRELQPEVVLEGGLVDAYPEPQKEIVVTVRYEYIRQRLGHLISDSEIRGMLEKLGFVYTSEECVRVPYYRATRDISIEDDFVEEVGRTIGYESITPQAPSVESVAEAPRPVQKAERSAREFLAANGFSESYLHSFMSSERAAMLGYTTENLVCLQNPVDAEQDAIRTTLLPGLLEVASENARHHTRLLLFELGRAYSLQASPLHQALSFRPPHKNLIGQERRLLSLAYSSGRSESSSEAVEPQVPTGVEFYRLAGVLRRLLAQLSLQQVQLHPIESGARNAKSAEMDWDFRGSRSWMHPYRAAYISVEDTCVGHLAEVQEKFRGECRSRLILAEIDLELVLSVKALREEYRPFSRYPSSFFEMSVIMPEKEPYEALEGVLRSALPAEQLREITPLSVYQGKPIPDGFKSVSLRLSFGLEHGTLSGAELDALQECSMASIREADYSLRS